MEREELALGWKIWKGEVLLQGRNVSPGGKSSDLLLLEIKLWVFSLFFSLFKIASLKTGGGWGDALKAEGSGAVNELMKEQGLQLPPTFLIKELP